MIKSDAYLKTLNMDIKLMYGRQVNFATPDILVPAAKEMEMLNENK